MLSKTGQELGHCLLDNLVFPIPTEIRDSAGDIYWSNIMKSPLSLRANCKATEEW